MSDAEGDCEEPGSPTSDYDNLAFPDIDCNVDGPSSFGADGDAVLRKRINFKRPKNSGAPAIPFQAIHQTPLKFKSPHRKVFIPGQEIQVKITDYERNVTTHLLNPNLYTIQFQHGDFTWCVKKRYKHFQNLHQQLKLYRTSLSIPFPTKEHRERRMSFKNDMAASEEGKGRGSLPRFPRKPDALVPFEQIEHRIQQLEEYLRNLLKIKLYRNHYETLDFMEVSHLSFINELGIKGKEGLVQKRTGSVHPGKRGCNFFGLLDTGLCIRCNRLCSDIFGTWRKRWFFVKDTCVGYVRPKDGQLKCVMLMDAGFEVSSGLYAVGLPNCVQISNLSKQIVIKCWTKRKSKEWIACLKEVAANEAGREFTQKNRHDSFAPVRTNIQAHWFVDGASYMEAVADALESAREEIFIADWWLSPEIFMKRPCMEGNRWRLDKILERKAKQGVKVFVMLYKEVEMALGINSYYSKQKLVERHENIKVLRHPDHVKVGVYFWAHHEKIVVIDQLYAFVGGIDLCYGRWDDHRHRLTDLGSVTNRSQASYLPVQKLKTSSRPSGGDATPMTLLQLAQASNTVTVGVVQSVIESETQEEAVSPEEIVAEIVEDVEGVMDEDAVEMCPTLENMKADTPELPRKSILERVMSVKLPGRDWFSGTYERADEDSEDGVDRKDANDVNKSNEELVDEKAEMEEAPVLEEKPADFDDEGAAGDALPRGLSGSAKLWLGKDYTNFIVKDFANLHEPYQDLVDRTTTPRMPWHDIGVLVSGTAARDVARHFIQRWNAVKLEKARMNAAYPCLLPKSYESLKLSPVDFAGLPFCVNCQVLRSGSHWSIGFSDPDMTEESIHLAYIDAITQAKHYIYIENQFFITLSMDQGDVRNQIGEALFKRILRAHREQTKFRVYVVMPLLPGFEGEIGSPKGAALHAIIYWNYASISRGKDSLVGRLLAAGVPDPSEYVSFYGLRTHSFLHGELVTELIYVHSKLMIVDDQLVICGSANINDRSLIGKRDSEIAVIIEDQDFEDSTMNEEPYQCGKYAGSLRRKIFQEHLGLLNETDSSGIDVTDPVADSFYNDVWRKVAKSNTEIYEKVFHCIPSDDVTSFYKLKKKFQEERPLCCTNPSDAEEELENIQGHLVEMPLDFLKSEILTPNPVTLEGVMPTALWT